MTTQPTTELDKALAAFFTDNESEENRARFYELFLNSSFFMPIIPQDKKRRKIMTRMSSRTSRP